MSTTPSPVIPIETFRSDPEEFLRRCLDSGEELVVQMSDRRQVALVGRPDPAPEAAVDDDLVDRLIETNADFRKMLEKSLAGPRRPFKRTTDRNAPDGETD
jgi:hypothetical protein